MQALHFYCHSWLFIVEWLSRYLVHLTSGSGSEGFSHFASNLEDFAKESI